MTLSGPASPSRLVRVRPRIVSRSVTYPAPEPVPGRLASLTAMSRLEVLPFDESHLPDAGRLLAARHRRHRAVEPLLPARSRTPRTCARPRSRPCSAATTPPARSRCATDGWSATCSAPPSPARLGPQRLGRVRRAGRRGRPRTPATCTPRPPPAGSRRAARRTTSLVPAHDDGAGRRVVPARLRAPAHARRPRRTDGPAPTPPHVRVRRRRPRRHPGPGPAGPRAARPPGPGTDLLRRRRRHLRGVAWPSGRRTSTTRTSRPSSPSTTAGGRLGGRLPAGEVRQPRGLARPDSAGFLGFAAVFPEDRGLGAGRALAEAVLDWSRGAGARVRRHRLAGHEPAVLPGLAGAGLPADVPAAAPAARLLSVPRSWISRPRAGRPPGYAPPVQTTWTYFFGFSPGASERDAPLGRPRTPTPTPLAIRQGRFAWGARRRPVPARGTTPRGTPWSSS